MVIVRNEFEQQKRSGRPEFADEFGFAGLSQDALHAFGLGDGDGSAGGSEAVVAAALIVLIGRGAVAALYDQTFGEQTLENGVKRPGAEPDLSGGLLLHILENGVSVLVAFGKRKKHLEDGRI